MNYGYLFTEKLGTDILWAREYCLMFVCLLSTRDQTSASKSIIRRFVITEKAPTMAFSWLKALTPRSLNVKLGPQCKSQSQAGGLVSIVSYSRPSLMIIVQPVVEPMGHSTALILMLCCHPAVCWWWSPSLPECPGPPRSCGACSWWSPRRSSPCCSSSAPRHRTQRPRPPRAPCFHC